MLLCVVAAFGATRALQRLRAYDTRASSVKGAKGDPAQDARSSSPLAASKAKHEPSTAPAVEPDGQAGAPAEVASPQPSSSPSKVLPSSDASPEQWRAAIGRYQREASVVGLQAVVEARPGRTQEERAQLLAEATRSLASLGEEARPSFDDLLNSPFREVRLAAINAFALAFPAERGPVLTALSSDPDGLIAAKAQALIAALR